MKRNVKLILAYEGTAYLGWQKTAMGPSIEQELEKVLTQILRHPLHLQAASRTDAGVHAEGQVVNFFTETDISLERLQKSLNGLLPPDISVLKMEEAPESFHPTLNSRRKEYHYSVCLGPTQLPFYRNFSWHFSYPVHFEEMKKAADHLKGKHDFSAFTNEKQEDNVREIFDIVLEMTSDRLKIRVSGNNFLYKMVRNIVGTLLYVGCGKITAEQIPAILKSQDRTKAGVTAPAQGLVLKEVFYD
ncbi:MAG: tRNA pseudouridine(38-40) synthase TruA [Verrucomicrobia bacterium]|nr:tRNA pseudouridine(38-40) synthase TruA [Verrucomicrobiota bacterium]